MFEAACPKVLYLSTVVCTKPVLPLIIRMKLSVVVCMSDTRNLGVLREPSWWS